VKLTSHYLSWYFVCCN